LLLVQGLVLYGMERWRPEVRDPEYGYKLARLRQRLTEAPDRPLVLALGSSRTLMGFRPELLPAYHTPAGETPLVFNFGLSGCNPMQQRLYLQRLLDAGIQPRQLWIEVIPVYQGANDKPENFIPFDRLAWSDLRVLCSFGTPAAPLYFRWVYERLVPWFFYRYGLVSWYAPQMLPPEHRQDQLWSALSDLGWRSCGSESVTPEQFWHSVEAAHKDHGPYLEHYGIADVPDRALREMLVLCRSKGIATVLYTMPEAKVYRDWYSPQAQATVAAYLNRLAREYQVPVVDTRDWVADTGFADSQHMLPCGAEAFTRQFGQEALGPVLEGREAVGP
jgi:hypothetical protein